MQCCMPISTPYPYACLTRLRPARRGNPPLCRAQGHAATDLVAAARMNHGPRKRKRNESST